jgi:hypothetical protein
MSEAYDGPEIVGMDLHRRCSVSVRMAADDRKLETARITNSPGELRRVIFRADKRPRVVLKATYGWVLGSGHAGCGRCAGASGALAGGDGVPLPPGQERRERRRGSGRLAADGAAAGGATRSG